MISKGHCPGSSMLCTGAPVDACKPGPQALVTPHELLETLVQNRDIQRPFEPIDDVIV